MRKLLMGLYVATLAVSAHANPMLDVCMPFAPKVCGLTDKPTQAEFLSCFETVKLDAGKAREAACAEELAHARVHGACDAGDIPTLCAGIKPGGSRTMNCLRKNEKKLGKDCLKALKDYDAIVGPKSGGRSKRKGGHAGVSAVRC